MTRARIADLAGTVHHAGNRGINQKDIFESDLDHADYLNRMILALEETKSKLLSFCLLQNHTHFLILVGVDGGLGRIFEQVNRGYVKAFNRRHGRSGPLFEGRHWNEWVEGSQYLANAQLYIEANPVVADLADEPDEWVWSSASHFMIEPCHPFLGESRWYSSLGNSSAERRRQYRKEMRNYLRIHLPPRSQRR